MRLREFKNVTRHPFKTVLFNSTCMRGKEIDVRVSEKRFGKEFSIRFERVQKVASWILLVVYFN